MTCSEGEPGGVVPARHQRDSAMRCMRPSRRTQIRRLPRICSARLGRCWAPSRRRPTRSSSMPPVEGTQEKNPTSRHVRSRRGVSPRLRTHAEVPCAGGPAVTTWACRRTGRSREEPVLSRCAVQPDRHSFMLATPVRRSGSPATVCSGSAEPPHARQACRAWQLVGRRTPHLLHHPGDSLPIEITVGNSPRTTRARRRRLFHQLPLQALPACEGHLRVAGRQGNVVASLPQDAPSVEAGGNHRSNLERTEGMAWRYKRS